MSWNPETGHMTCLVEMNIFTVNNQITAWGICYSVSNQITVVCTGSVSSVWWSQRAVEAIQTPGEALVITVVKFIKFKVNWTEVID